MQLTEWIEFQTKNKVNNLSGQLKKSWARENKQEKQISDLKEVVKYYWSLNWAACRLCPAIEYNGGCPLLYQHPPDFAECLPRMIAAVKNE